VEGESAEVVVRKSSKVGLKMVRRRFMRTVGAWGSGKKRSIGFEADSVPF